MYGEFLDLIVDKVKEIKEKEGPAIRKAAEMITGSLMAGKWVYTFGSGHSQLLAIEIHARAGGLYPIVHIPDPMNGKAEKIEGFGEVLVKNYAFQAGETIFVISNSGRNPEPIEVALVAKKAGMNVIVVTNMEHSRSVTSRHSSGKMLYDLGDLVLDTHGPLGDASMKYEGMEPKAGALSTVFGAVVLNAVVVEAIQVMLERKYEPPVLMSANLDGSDEYNMRIVSRFGPMPVPREI